MKLKFIIYLICLQLVIQLVALKGDHVYGVSPPTEREFELYFCGPMHERDTFPW